MNKDNKDCITVQFDILKERLGDIDELVLLAGFESRREFFDHAISILEVIIQAEMEGKVFAFIDENDGKYHKIEMKFLTHLRDFHGLMKKVKG
jgi:hypothetical protein